MADERDGTASSLFKAIIQHDKLEGEQLRQLETCTEFSFRTVVQKRVTTRGFTTRSSCDCAYIHEFFTYVDNDGSIISSDLDTLCSWINKGECPHVAISNPERHKILTSSVTSLDAAVASGNTSLYHVYEYVTLPPTPPRSYQVFKVTTTLLAVIKQRYSFLEYMLAEKSQELWHALCLDLGTMSYMLECHGPTHDRYFSVYSVSPARLCIIRNDLRMLEYFLLLRPNFPAITQEILYAFHENKEHFVRAMIAYVMDPSTRPIFYFSHKIMQELVLDATLFDHPDMLQLLEEFKLISARDPDDMTRAKSYVEWAYHLSIALGHDQCTDILKNWVNVSGIRPFIENAYTIAMIQSSICSDEEQCKRLLRKLHNCGFDMSVKNAPTLGIITMDTSADRCYIRPGIIAQLLELGAKFSLMDCIWLYKKPEHFKQLIKAFLYHNAINNEELIRHQKKYLEFDAGVADEGPGHEINYAKFQMEHSAKNADDFIVPLLWECGFQVVRQLALDPNIPDIVAHYLHHVISEPRPLKMQCRDTMRRHFLRRNLHKFVQLIDCPTCIKDYILISHLLKDRKITE